MKRQFILGISLSVFVVVLMIAAELHQFRSRHVVGSEETIRDHVELRRRLSKHEVGSARTIKQEVDIHLDEKSAIQIAEIVLTKVYGERVLEEKPWMVTENETFFTVEGTRLGKIEGVEATNGGVAFIEVKKTNGEVISITHGK